VNRPDERFVHEWHVAINQYHYGENYKKVNEYQSWLYDAKTIADEVPRLVMLFKAERLGELPQVHQQCSRSEVEQVKSNHLSCCMGVKCKECPFLLALEGSNVSLESLDEIKAWTCVTHILTEKAKNPMSFDDSEGFIVTEDDKMYWQHVYKSLSQANEIPDDDDKNP
jgi:hypothetical protein